MPADPIAQYGYIAVALVALLEGESALVLAGIAVSAGQLAFLPVVGAAVAGSVAGDQAFFHAARRWACRILAGRPTWQAATGRVLRVLGSRPDFLMVTFRFCYGLRSVTPVAIGAAGVDPLRFLALNIAGASAWACAYAAGGCLLGDALPARTGAAGVWPAVVIALAATGILAWRFVAGRRVPADAHR